MVLGDLGSVPSQPVTTTVGVAGNFRFSRAKPHTEGDVRKCQFRHDTLCDAKEQSTTR